MTASAQTNQYLDNHYQGMTSEQLILMLYKGALDRIRLTGEGIDENNPQKRGENLSKAIAIVSELNASLDPSMNDDATQFLRGLYGAILSELPKVSITNDKEILRLAYAYISKLKQIWEEDVMNDDLKADQNGTSKTTQKTVAGKNDKSSFKNGFHSISV